MQFSSRLVDKIYISSKTSTLVIYILLSVFYTQPASIGNDFRPSVLNYAELMVDNVLVYAAHLFVFDTLSKHSKTFRSGK